MRNRSLRSFIALLICVGFIYTPILQAAQLSLPSGDLVAPEVSHEVIQDSLEAGSSVQIKAKVTDNVGVKSVTLFYRTKGTEEYNRISMNRIGETDNYAITLGKDELVEPGIEYYIQAMDLAGNSLLHGYSFAPLAVNVVPTISKPAEAVTQQEELPSEEMVGETISEEPETEKTSSKKKWLWIGLGVLAVGVIAAAASGGDDGGGGSDTGTIVISGPNP